MALCYTRLLCRRTTAFSYFRNLHTSKTACITTSESLKATTGGICETHDEKNMRLKRPMSPHLTIYQVQLTAVLSITHRATGMMLSTYGMALGLGTLFYPGGVPCMIETIQDLHMSLPIFFVIKLLLAFPAAYHTINGFRHLAWDMGMFLTIKQVYSTGYITVALAAIGAIALATL